MHFKYNNSLLSVFILLIISYISSCTHYMTCNYNISVIDINEVEDVRNEQGHEYSYSVKQLDKEYSVPLIYDYPYHSQIIARPNVWLGKGHVIGPQHYSVFLPKGIRYALKNQSCELLLLYNHSQAIWIWDDEYRNQEDAKNLNIKLNLPDGYHKLDNESLNYIFSQFNPVSSFSQWDNPKRAPLNGEIRHLIIKDNDTLAYDRFSPMFSAYFTLGEVDENSIAYYITEPYRDTINNTIYETKKIFKPESIKDRMFIELPKRKKGRTNFIFIKDGVFILAYNILPMNEKIFKTMIEQTFQIHSAYQRIRYYRNILESDLNCKMNTFGYYQITLSD